MQRHISKGRKNGFITIAICLLLYIGLSIAVRFPLGFGKMMARELAWDYCQAVYPQAVLGETVFNPVATGYSTCVSVGDEYFDIVTYPNQDAVGDRSRSEAFLQDSGAAEVISRLWRTHFSDKVHSYIYGYVVWSHTDPTTPGISLHINYTDYDRPTLPDDAEMKMILTPIALDCVAAVEECVPLDCVRLSYYHPDFDPHEKEMTWRIMEVSLDGDVPRNKDLLDDAQVIVK